MPTVIFNGLHQAVGVGQIDRATQTQADVVLQSGDERVQLAHELFHTRLHQCSHGGGEQVDGPLLAATQAGTIAAGEGLVVVFVE